MLYVPSYTNNNCVVYYSEGVIRVYDTTPTANSSINYREYFSNSHYDYRDGVQQFGNFYTAPTCINHNQLTTNVYYRNDLDSILVCFIIIIIFCFYFPYRLISRMFGRWLKI